MTLVQTEPKSIKIRKPNVANMQWPCPTGFHVPTNDDNIALIAAMTSLGINTSNGNCLKTYLKMPFAWSLNNTWGLISGIGGYISSTSVNTWANRIYATGTSLAASQQTIKAWWNSIRPFKNEAVTPDNTRTTLYGTLSAWIFMKGWLISISSDWVNWITIADKNLWATTVYNDGDTLSEANCWKRYQWWNNYGFPYTWTFTTSSTKVDASTYWPWNYYSSSTFITVSASPYDWSSVQNDNLRWWAYSNIKRVTIRPSGTEKQIRPATRNPWANTIAYYPLTASSTTTDMSWNSNTLTPTWGITFWTYGWISCCSINSWMLSASISYSWPHTENIRYYETSAPTQDSATIIGLVRSWAPNNWHSSWVLRGRTRPSSSNGLIAILNDNAAHSSPPFTVQQNVWYNICYTYNGSTAILYVNWNLSSQVSYSWSVTYWNLVISRYDQYDRSPNWYLSEAIFENKVRTAQEVSDYYNLTKSKYWL